MMRRRSVGRSMARTAVTTAVVVGTAGAVQNKQQQKYASQQARSKRSRIRRTSRALRMHRHNSRLPLCLNRPLHRMT